MDPQGLQLGKWREAEACCQPHRVGWSAQRGNLGPTSVPLCSQPPPGASASGGNPTGKEIYRKSNISVYEVDGKDHKVSSWAEFMEMGDGARHFLVFFTIDKGQRPALP